MSFFLVTFCCAFAALGSFLLGYESGMISSSIEQEAFLRRFGSPGLVLSESAMAGIVSSYIGGAIVGSILTPYIADYYGRRMVLFVGSLLATLGTALQGGAINMAMLIAGRCIAGLAVGQMSATIPVYCSEMAPPQIRGMLASMQNWMIGLGILVAVSCLPSTEISPDSKLTDPKQWVGYGSSLRDGPFSWRFPLSLQVAPAILLTLGIWFLPESPRWLAEQGQNLKARSVLARLDKTANITQLDHELSQIHPPQKQPPTPSWRTLFSARYRRRLLLACSLQLFTQSTGTALIQTYTPSLTKTLPQSPQTTLLIIGLWTALSQLWNTLFMPLIDKLNRRTLLIPSLLGTGATICIEATLLRTLNTNNSNTNTPTLHTAIAMFFLFSLFSTPLNMISWIYQCELFPTPLRARSSALATAANWIVKLVLAHCSPVAFAHIGYNYLYCFAGFTWVAFIVVWVFFPETNGRTLEEVQGVFEEVDDVRSVRSLEGVVQVDADDVRRSQIRARGLHPLSMHPTSTGSLGSDGGSRDGFVEGKEV
ncbi:uncharacterized protein N7515_006563 [Penicillium bovifimosum]|uniref:Major facilitator superfamily (MFS) profile domain-containing protein n=1 Tax=Penicillium bovifimosum TaxID=126998 RepID=A0A9W9GWH3_9EURO|nr:uncharacterized protein N7515_006563 [Penicillium bovifimosum]KAJ5130524.1 hypothetical protein N7515_006563 [Penicillium bovifimosum]